MYVTSILQEDCQTKMQPSEVFCKKGVLRNFAKFIGKHLCQSLFFNKVPRENNKNNKNNFTFLIFYLLSSSFFFSDFTFYKEALCFIIFILSLCSNTLTLETILECINQKLKKKNMLILKFHPEMKCLHIFFSFF